MDVSELRLKERTALLVGPLSRVHQSLAHRLTQLGADVVMATPQPDQAQRFALNLGEAREIQEKFGRAASVPLQAGSAKAARDMVSRAAESFGGIDILIESAAVMAPQMFAEDSLERLAPTIESNLLSAIYTAHAVTPFLKGRKRGRMVFLLNEHHMRGFAGASLQAAARSGLVGFMKTMAVELAEQNITVNGVSQGLTEEFLTGTFPKVASAQAGLQELRKVRPSAQMVDAERVSDTVTFLVSQLGAGVTGQVLTVGT